MGFWDTIKGWFNIGGVSVKITQVDDPFPRENSHLKGSFRLTTKIPKTVLSTRVTFYGEETIREEKDGKTEEKTERTSFGEWDTKHGVAGEYPFELAAGESRDIPFVLHNVNVDGVLSGLTRQKGIVGAVGQAVSFTVNFAAGSNLKYYVEAHADVKGAAFDPSDRVQIRLASGRS